VTRTSTGRPPRWPGRRAASSPVGRPACHYALTGTDGKTWGQVIDEQKLGTGVGRKGSGARYEVGFPVLQYRGLLEEVIPASTEDATRGVYCDARITTRWTLYPGDHLLSDQQAKDDVVKWLGDRFAGRPEPGNCPLS
jgi:triacylglycerol lipase